MSTKKESALAPVTSFRDPFGLLRQMTSEFDRLFEGTGLPAFRFPTLRSRAAIEAANWSPEIDVYEKDNRLITKVDLPGITKDNVKVEVADGYLTISGERSSEAEEKKRDFYTCERAYGSFYRTVPLPEGVKADDVKASFANGVLEVSVPLPAKPENKTTRILIEEGPKATKVAA